MKTQTTTAALSVPLHRFFRLRDVGFAWLAQAAGAFVMLLCGQVGIETLSAAIWFPGLTLLIVWLKPQKPNDKNPATGSK